MCFCRYLLVFYLKLCNDFSNAYLQLFEILVWGLIRSNTLLPM